MPCRIEKAQSDRKEKGLPVGSSGEPHPTVRALKRLFSDSGGKVQRKVDDA